MKTNSELDRFNTAMDTILRADPKAVKAAVEAEIRANTAQRQATGQRKRGRKPTVKK
jgi:hypothetical protein